MAYELKEMFLDEFSEMLAALKWLEVPGDWNSSPSPIQRITEGQFARMIRSQIPRWIEPRQLLDQPFEEQQFRAALLYWFDDCGIMMLFPEGLSGIASMIEYYRVGCVHQYEDRKLGLPGKSLAKARECKLCEHTLYIPI